MRELLSKQSGGMRRKAKGEGRGGGGAYGHFLGQSIFKVVIIHHLSGKFATDLVPWIPLPLSLSSTVLLQDTSPSSWSLCLLTHILDSTFFPTLSPSETLFGLGQNAAGT